MGSPLLIGARLSKRDQNFEFRIAASFGGVYRVHKNARTARRIAFVLSSTVFAWHASLAAATLAQRGAEVFQANCIRCHVAADINTRVRTNWLGRNANELMQKIKTTMPAEMPGSLSDSEYQAVTPYVLSLADIKDSDALDNAAQFSGFTIAAATATKQAALPNVGWPQFNGDFASRRYSPLAHIDASNAAKLQIAWHWQAGMFGPSPELKNVSTPIVADDVMYATVGTTRNVVAIDPGTGQLLWMWRTDEGKRFDVAARKGSGRGVAYWRSGDRRRVFTVTPGYFLVSLDAVTGRPDPAFASNGSIDLEQGLRLAKDRKEIDIGLSFPPFVMNDVVVVGAAMQVAMRPPTKSNVKGDIRGFDARTGELLWTFHTIPMPGEPGAETWLNGSADYTGNAGVWTAMSGDPELGLVYLPVEAATGDRYGGDRPGANLFANSLVALDVKTGKMRWHYQIIHHDIWDWDNPSAPILADLPAQEKSPGKKIIVQLTKQAFAYTFDRTTGKPIWPFKETRVRQSDVPGEWTSKTQPFPTKPVPFDRQGLSEQDLIDFTPEILAAAKAAAKPYRLGPLFSPSSLADAKDGTKGTLTLPSSTGGANWESGAFDPDTGILYVPSRTSVELLSLIHDAKASTVEYIQGIARPPKALGLPLVKPPWGRITAIDMKNGEHLWWIANADTPTDVANNPALKGVNLPRTGIPTRAGILLTKTLLFAGEGWGGSPVFRAIDKKTGKILAEIKLPAGQAGQPISYRHNGRQYIAMFVGDGKQPGELIALVVPEARPLAKKREE